MLWRAAGGLAIVVFLSGPAIAEGQLQSCSASPKLTGQCFDVQGRLFLASGTPGIRIRPSGTKRLLGVVNSDGSDSENDATLPAQISKIWLQNRLKSAVIGDFNVCPLSHETPGAMRMVCIAGATNLSET